MFITGFKPFSGNKVNPTELIADALSSGYETKALTVTYDAVDEFMWRFPAQDYDAIVCLGLHGKAEDIHLERFAYNETSRTHPDMAGMISEQIEIDPLAPNTLETSLPIQELCNALRGEASLSDNPGRYLCNYIYFKALKKMKGRAIFIHVPPISEKWTLERMIKSVQVVLARLEDMKAD